MRLCQVLLFLFIFNGYAQDLYKTPSGKKYHLSTCRMVENVSAKLVNGSSVSDYNLSACKICKPPVVKSVKSFTSIDKSVGKSKSIRCNGITKAGSRCKHSTRLANGYCYQHTAQNHHSNAVEKKNRPAATSRLMTSTCGAPTKSGRPCRRKVKNNRRCYQH